MTGAALAQDAREPEALDNGDGTYSYADPDDLMPGARVVEGGITWEYVGQARYSYRPEPFRGTPARGGTHVLQPPSAYEQVMQTQRTDGYGRRWKVVEVDEAWLRDVLLADPDPADGPISLDLHRVPPPVEVMDDVIPTSWTMSTCDGVFIQARWNADNRSRITGELKPRQKAVVSIFSRDINDPSLRRFCTGTVIGPEKKHILTAAHCLWDSSENGWMDVGKLEVCIGGNDDDIDGTSCAVGNRYTNVVSNGLWEVFRSVIYDYAIFELHGLGGAENMALSQAPFNNISSYNMHNLGFPANLPGSGCSSATGPGKSGFWHDGTGHFLYHHMFKFDTTYSNPPQLFYRQDTSVGQSGSPVYYCPMGDYENQCEPGDKAYQVAVHSSWWAPEGATGPAVASFRNWAQIFINQ